MGEPAEDVSRETLAVLRRIADALEVIADRDVKPQKPGPSRARAPVSEERRAQIRRDAERRHKSALEKAGLG